MGVGSGAQQVCSVQKRPGWKQKDLPPPRRPGRSPKMVPPLRFPHLPLPTQTVIKADPSPSLWGHLAAERGRPSKELRSLADRYWEGWGPGRIGPCGCRLEGNGTTELINVDAVL